MYPPTDGLLREKRHRGPGLRLAAQAQYTKISVCLSSAQLADVRALGPCRSHCELDLSVSVESLGVGLSHIDGKEVPPHAGIIEYAYKRVGWDPNRFHVYRYQVIYPVPLVSFTWWLPLADPPE